MARSLAAEVGWLGDHLVELVGRLPENVTTTRPGAQAPPIAFHAWHAGRWADRLAAAMPRLVDRDAAAGVEVWDRDGWAARWGFSGDLGTYSSGWGLSDDVAADLPWPPSRELTGYISAAFGALATELDRLSDVDLTRDCHDLYDDESTVAQVIVGHLSHVARHLGMVEGIAGSLGERGTATS